MGTPESEVGTIDNPYLVNFSDEFGMILGLEVVGDGDDTRIVLQKREGCTDEEIVDIVNEILVNPNVEVTDPDVPD